jgi:fluoroquinolone transport system permease protein
MRAVRALGPIDARSVARDPLLRWIVIYPIMVAAIVRWGAPPLAARLLAQFQFDLTPSYPLVSSFLLIMTPLLTGTVVGFLLLDQRDDHTLAALQVTPLTLNGYLVYRVAVPILLSALISLLVVPLAGLTPLAPGALLAAALAAAPVAPFYALFLAAFASNKVEGFALTKAGGVLLVPPLIAYLIPGAWHWAFGVVPLFWPARLLWALARGEALWWLVLLAGLAYQAVLIALLLRRFNRAANL